MNKLITILGPTATGKTNLATHLAYEINGEIISADSRQVYRKLDIGTGKDLKEYVVNEQQIPYHLIDICDVGYEYNVFEFQQDFYKAYQDIQNRRKAAILCGGTGMYIQAVLDGYKLYPVPKNELLRAELESKSEEELVKQLTSISKLHNSTDTKSKARTIKAIEIALYCKQNNIEKEIYPALDSVVFGISMERSLVRNKITIRLRERLRGGLIEEVEQLLKEGVTLDQLKFLGLEYRFIAQYLNKELKYSEMKQKLTIAIHQFAKRQMTWFRRMEKQGHQIHWINSEMSLEEKVNFIKITSL